VIGFTNLFDKKLKTHSGFLGNINTFSSFHASSLEKSFCLYRHDQQLDGILVRSKLTLPDSIFVQKLFFPHTCDDEKHDAAVQKRIRSLNWISAPLLDCRINELDSYVRDIFEKAITHTSCHKLSLSSSLNTKNSLINLDLIEMDGQKAYQDKLA
jgi:hypothetical protein